jgi:hypothetical protein
MAVIARYLSWPGHVLPFDRLWREKVLVYFVDAVRTYGEPYGIWASD